MITRLGSEVDQVDGRRLGLVLVTFHVHLACRNWLSTLLETGETIWVEVPAFSQGMNMLEVQNNLM
jgi:DNA-binding transcriptional MocR family regulator